MSIVCICDDEHQLHALILQDTQQMWCCICVGAQLYVPNIAARACHDLAHRLSLKCPSPKCHNLLLNLNSWFSFVNAQGHLAPSSNDSGTSHSLVTDFYWGKASLHIPLSFSHTYLSNHLDPDRRLPAISIASMHSCHHASLSMTAMLLRHMAILILLNYCMIARASPASHVQLCCDLMTGEPIRLVVLHMGCCSYC